MASRPLLCVCVCVCVCVVKALHNVGLKRRSWSKCVTAQVLFSGARGPTSLGLQHQLVLGYHGDVLYPGDDGREDYNEGYA